MKRHLRLFAAALAVEAAALAAFSLCQAQAQAARRAQQPQQQPQFASPVKPGEPEKKFPTKVVWVLKEFNGKPVPAGSDLTLTIDDTYRGSGASGCNTWSATVYPSRGQRLGVGPVAITHNTCDQAKTALENAYLTAVHAAPFWDIEGGDLVLKSPAGVLRFQRSI